MLGTRVALGQGRVRKAKVPLFASDVQAVYVVGAQEQATVTMLGDDSSSPANRRALDSTSNSFAPAWSASAVGGSEPGLSFSGSTLGVGDNATDAPAFWKFGHQRTGCTFVVRCHPTASINSTVIAATHATTSAGDVGMALLYDGGNQRFWSVVANASGSILDIRQAVNGAPRNNPYTVIFRFDDSQAQHGIIRVNGTQVINGNFTGAASSSNAARGLRLGQSYGAGTNNFAGGIKLFAAYNRTLTANEITQWETVAPTLTSPRTRRVMRFIGDSKTANAASWRVKLWKRISFTTGYRAEYVGAFSAGNYPLADLNHDGVSGQTIEQITSRINGYSGEPISDFVVMAGRNNAGGGDPSGMRDLMGTLLDTAIAKHGGINYWVLPDSLGDLTEAPATTATVTAYNALLPALCANKGCHFVDIYSGAYAYAGGASGDTADGTGHPTPQGYDKIGNTLAVAMGFGGD